jgi:hypothetical protein
MVKKLVLQFTGPQTQPQQEEDYHSLLLLNDSLLEIVTKYKDKITEYYKSRLWDKYKKLSNEYEHIFYSPNAHGNIALYNPVSRSFFKLWEILYDFQDITFVNSPTPLKCVFIAEGPGGFFEAFYKKRQELFPSLKDKYHGITLKSNNNKNIPDWKTQESLPIKISYGKDGTGNLYKLENIQHFAKEVGYNSVDFITADGGFDFSSDFNNQEEQSFKLIASEVLSTMYLQRRGGVFLLKLYDCFNTDTLSIIQILKSSYETLYFIKPLTSRPANSERYILCHGFIGCKQEYISKLESLLQVAAPLKLNLTYNVVYNIVLYNMYYTIRQVFYIQRTINYINFFKKQTEDSVMNHLLEKHTIKSKKWCKKYMIPYKL